MTYVLAVDFGTSGCRSAVYNEKLQMLCVAVEEYPLIVHSETEIEQDANVWWDKAKKTIKKAPILSVLLFFLLFYSFGVKPKDFAIAKANSKADSGPFAVIKLPSTCKFLPVY